MTSTGFECRIRQWRICVPSVDHLAGRDPAVARHVLDDIRTAIERLVRFPELGHVRDDLADRQLRVWTVHTYLVIQLPDTAPLQVVRIRHGYRNLSAILG